MKKILALLICFSFVFATDFRIKRDYSTVMFEGKHMGLIKVIGFFNDYFGKISFDMDNKVFSEFDGSVRIDSIDTRNKHRDMFLKSPLFFDMNKFPEIRISMQSYEKIDDVSGVIHGVLNLKGKNYPINLNVNIIGLDNLMNSVDFVFEATTVINRKEVGLTWNDFVEGKIPIIDDVVKIDLIFETEKVMNRVTKKKVKEKKMFDLIGTQ